MNHARPRDVRTDLMKGAARTFEQAAGIAASLGVYGRAAAPAVRRRSEGRREEGATWAVRTGGLLAIVTIVRCLIARRVGLSDTEAYYAEWARVPSLSYYDHPPLVAWSTWLWTHVAGPGAVRFGPILYAAAFGALLYKLAARLFSPRAGFFAVAIVTAIPAFFFTGFLLNPEGILAPLWVLALLLIDDLRENDEPWRPLALGAVIGVAFVAKYTAILLVPVTLLHALVSRFPRRWLVRPSFYLSGVVALVVASPVVAWNVVHGWPSMHLHLSERIGRPVGETLPDALTRVAVGQVFLFQPIVVAALLAVFVLSFRRAWVDRRYRFLLTASAPVLGFLLYMMVRAGDSEPHWTMVGYVPLIVAAAGLLDESRGSLRRYATWTLRAALTTSAVMAALYVASLRAPALARSLPSYDPNADPINETLGWDRVAGAVHEHAAALGPGTVVAGAHNVLCGHVEAAVDDTPAVYCASPRRTEYDFIGRRSPPADVPVVFVNSDRYPDDPAAALPDHRCALVEDVAVARGDLPIGRYRIHECLPEHRSHP